MKKLLTAIFVIISLLVSILPVSAKESDSGNLLINGDFETIGADGLPSVWKYMSGTTTLLTEGMHKGKSAIRMEHTDNMYIMQTVTPVSNEKYTVSFWARLGNENQNSAVQAAVKIEGYNSSRENDTNVTKAFDLTKRWTQYTFEFTTSEDQMLINFMLRMFSGGVVYFDDVELTGKLPEGFSGGEEYKVSKDAKSIPADGVQNSIDSKEYFENGGFEDNNGVGPTGWSPAGGSWQDNQYVSYSQNTSHSGSSSVKISTQSGGNPWVNQLVNNLEEGATYQLTGWYNSNASTASIICKLEFYSDNRIAPDCFVTSTTTLQYSSTQGNWKQIISNFTMPKGGKSVAIYPRLLAATGTVYFDDMSLVLIKKPSPGTLDTDETFYYTGTKTGSALYTLRESDENYTDYKVSFSLSDSNGNVVAQKENATFGCGRFASFRYNPDSLILKEEYTVTAILYDAVGNECERSSRFIYRYDRPTAIDENGVYRVDGKAFYPSIIYHAGTAFKELSAIGVNVVQGSNYELDEYLKVLDEADKYGMKILVTLYPGMLPAGNDANAEHTKKIVNGVMNHPAVFAYAIQDEPFANNPNCEDDLRKSYKLIRDIDSVHPIYLCECFPNRYEISGKYVDCLCIDPYPSNEANVGSVVAESAEMAKAAVKYKKPVYVLSSVFTFGNFKPYGYEIVNQFYQTMMAGGTWGMYPYNPDNAAIDKILPDSEFWPYLTAFYEKESKLLSEYFYEGLYPCFNKGIINGCHYESFMKDGAVYLLVYNESREPKDANIPLKSQNGKVNVTVNNIEIINGAETMNASADNDVLNIKLMSTQSVLYKLSINESIDNQELNATRFTDTANYDWAKDSIYTLENKDILNGDDKFRPGESITRADFAMFLVKTLGLYANEDSNFDDVDKDLYYAESISIGRKFGILNGVGDNKYLPDSMITREDLMTIIARGLGLNGEADLSSFTDSDCISDYAVSSVSAMVAAGLLKGNADGSLNPKGNASRAEAAVIMKRIIENLL